MGPDKRIALPLVGMALAACNALVGFDELKRTGPVGADAAPAREAGVARGDGGTGNVPEDAGVAGPRCNPQKPFGAPGIVTALDGASNTGGALLTPDELEAFYIRSKEVRHARRASTDAEWSVETIATLTPAPDVVLSVTVDGLKLYYSRFIQTSSTSEFYAVSRSSRDAAFETPKKLQVPVLGFANSFFVVSSDDIVFFTKRNTSDKDGVVSTAIQGFGFTDAVLINHPAANVPSDESGPVSVILNAKGTNMYFNSDTEGVGKTKLWVARRASPTSAFTQPAALLTELTDGVTLDVSWASDDDCKLYLSRSSHIFVTRRPNAL